MKPTLPSLNRSWLGCGFLVPLLLSGTSVYAQRSLHLGVQVGGGLSYNRTLSNTVLPGHIRTFPFLCVNFNGTLTYLLNEHYGLEAAAGWYLTHTNIGYNHSLQPDSHGDYPYEGPGYAGYTNAYPLRQVQLRGLRYFPFGQGRFVGFVGAGASVVWSPYTRDENFGAYFETGDRARQFVRIRMEEDRRHSTGFLLGAQAGMEIRFSPRSTLQLSIQHHHGLRALYGARTTAFDYFDADRGIIESYEARFRNRGTYTVFSIGYQRRLWGS